MPTAIAPAPPAPPAPPARPGPLARPGPPARRASGQALAALYARHGSELQRYATRLTGDHHRAQDIVQEAMLRAWRHPEAIDDHCGTPRTWLYAVTRNLVIDEHRARRARPAEVAGLNTLASQAVSDPIDAAITRWDLAAALDGLKSRHRDLLGAHYLRDRSITQIAADLDVPAGTVKSRLSAARDALRQRLQFQGDAPAAYRPPAPRGTAAR